MKFYLALFVFVATASTASAKKKCFRIDQVPPKTPCEQDIVVGPCKAAMPRWAYDKFAKKCVQFFYGGCEGNDNRYETKEECEKACPCPNDQCGANEEYSDCINPCPPGAQCFAPCLPGCVCKKGYIRNENGECFKPQSECTKPNEKDGECSSLQCCICEDGYVRNVNSDCVKKESDSPCDQDIVVGPCEALFPSWAYDKSAKKCVQFTYGGCQGNDNRYESKEDCEKACPCSNDQCGVNEHYEACNSWCNQPTCKNRDPGFCRRKCEGGCYCDEGYIRNKDGKCIKIEECPDVEPTCTKPHEVFQCMKSASKGDPCFCVCEEGYVRDGKGDCVEKIPVCEQDIVVGPCKAKLLRWAYDRWGQTCVEFFYGGCEGNDNRYETKEECEKACPCSNDQCGVNEHYDECNSWCYQPTCEKQEIKWCKKPCEKGCFCDEGYVRDTNGDCIKIDECACTKPHEVFGCVNRPCPPGMMCAAIACRPTCICEEGYIRDDNGDCVKKQDIPVCEQDIVVGPCKAAMPRWAYDKFAKKCVQFFYGGCEGNDNRYETKEECEKACPCSNDQCGANEHYEACNSWCYQPTCEKRNPGLCKRKCEGGCYCDEGYIRNKDGKCIKIEECPAVCVRDFEEYKECGSSCAPTCDRPNEGVQCLDACIQGCFCQSGYVRDPSGECVKPEQCPPKNATCGEKEFYQACSTLCGEATCGSREPRYCGLGCQPRCHCKDGYIRDVPEGKCIKVEECPDVEPTCTKPHEVFQCMKSASKGDPCFCVCEEGYVRDGNGDCVETKPACEQDIVSGPCYGNMPSWGYDKLNRRCIQFTYGGCGGNDNRYESKEDCEKACPTSTNQCGAHEHYDECNSWCYEPNCEQREIKLCRKPCVKGCFCDEGYVRDINLECIKVERCLNCDKDFEEYRRCGTACPLTCANQTVGFCTEQCVPGCFCKAGYVRNDNDDCVLPSECYPVCSANQEYRCGTVCPRTCEEPKPGACTKNCRFGCHCKKGYLLDGEKCVKPEECPCETPCKEPIVVGPCKAAMPRWAYSPSAGKCIKFTYGGCEANTNNFLTYQACDDVCPSRV